MESRLLKRNPQPAKQISRPVTAKENAKPEPVSDTGVGGSSLDTMTAACATEMLNAASSFHKLHLKITGPGSYAVHRALNDLYEALPGHADSLIEGYQGAAEKILKCTESMPRELNDVQDAVYYLRDIYASITKLQAKMPYSEIVNSLDTAKDSINAAKYKLLFLS